MKWIALVLMLAAGFAAAPLSPSGPQDLVGTWEVDLRPAPDAPAYFQPFVITAVEDGRIEGTFYGSALERTEVNTAWDGVHIAFVTLDGSARYVTTARLLDGELSGVTYSPDRGLLQPWRARRAAD